MVNRISVATAPNLMRYYRRWGHNRGNAMKRVFVMFAAMLVFSGCVSAYQVQPLSGATNTIALSKQDSVYIALPADGQYGTAPAAGSGQLVAQVLAGEFSKYARSVQTAPNIAAQADDFGAARRSGCQYLVVPVITHWEQRATAWSGIPSKMALRVTIYDVASGKQLVSDGIQGHSASMTMFSTSPEKLLQAPVAKFVGQLYGQP